MRPPLFLVFAFHVDKLGFRDNFPRPINPTPGPKSHFVSPRLPAKPTNILLAILSVGHAALSIASMFCWWTVNEIAITSGLAAHELGPWMEAQRLAKASRGSV